MRVGEEGSAGLPCPYLQPSSGAQMRTFCPMGPGLLGAGHRGSPACGLHGLASSVPLSPAGKRCERSCCLQNQMRMLRACASLCPAAGRSQTLCAWALSSPQRASCERALWPPPPPPPRRTPAGPQRCLRERWRRWQAGHPLAGLRCLPCRPHAPCPTCSVSAL